MKMLGYEKFLQSLLRHETKKTFKVTGDSLLIHAFAYIFVDVYSVNSDVTGHSHSFHAIKLIHCGAPQRDVLSDKMVL